MKHKWIDVQSDEAQQGRMCPANKTRVRTHARRGAHRQSRRRKQQEVLLGERAVTVVQTLACPDPSNVYRQALVSGIVFDILGSNTLSKSQVGSIVTTLTSEAYAGPRTAWDALSLLNLGGKFHDERLLLRGQEMHCNGLSLLRRDIAQASQEDSVMTAGLADRILQTSHALLSCEVFSAVSSGTCTWDRQMFGIVNVLRARPGDCTSAPLFNNIRHLVLMRCLSKSRCLPYSEDMWALPNITPRSDNRIEWLVELALRLPRLLDMTRAEAQVYKSGEELASLRNYLETLIHDFEQWQSQQKTTLTPSVWLDKISDVPSEDIATSTRSRAYFGTFLDANILAFNWACWLLLYICAFNLSELQCSLISLPVASLIQEGNKYALSLGHVTQYLAQEAEGVACRSMAIVGPLDFISKWFIRTSQTHLLEKNEQLRSQLYNDLPVLDHESLVPWSFYSLRASSSLQ